MKYLLKALCVFERESGMVFGRESGMVFGRESGIVLIENNSPSLKVKI